jgi:hypothetical protein
MVKNMSMRAAPLARITGACCAAVAIAAVGTAGTAEAETSTMNTAWRPWSSPTSEGSQQWTVGKGTSVQMRCWTTGVNRLGTAKWFYIRYNAYPFTEGYVPANAVSNQTIVGHC